MRNGLQLATSAAYFAGNALHGTTTPAVCAFAAHRRCMLALLPPCGCLGLSVFVRSWCGGKVGTCTLFCLRRCSIQPECLPVSLMSLSTDVSNVGWCLSCYVCCYFAFRTQPHRDSGAALRWSRPDEVLTLACVFCVCCGCCGCRGLKGAGLI